MITTKTLKFFVTPAVLNRSNEKLKINKIIGNILTDDQKWKCINCGKEIYYKVNELPLIHCRCEYKDWEFRNQSLYIQKIYRNEDYTDLVAIKIGITEQDGNVRKNFTDSFSIYHHKLAFEVRMDYALAAAIEARIKRELPVGYVSKEEMKDGFTETASPDYWDQMLTVYEEMIATTDQPFLRVM
ncbi:hypothetical protein ACNPN6_06570 [Enterobacter quasiroggenkampii]|uniref:hypothetical protein n=1 Tax=Enterobacter quasiroggenkampii TaxID=2497436 RepID=UPI003AABC114